MAKTKTKRKAGRPPAEIDQSTPAGKLGARLRAARVAAAKTPADVAAALGVDHTTVSRWEHGEFGVSAETAVALARLYGVDVGRLLTAERTSRRPGCD